MFFSKPATRWTRILSCLLMVLLAAPPGLACDTPVYRYAMYRWQPAPYEIYFFHDKPAGEQDQRVAKQITEYSESRENGANIVYLAVNVAEDKELSRVPPHIKKLYLGHEKPDLPSYLVAMPFGAEMYFGKLDEAKVKALVESPARTALATQLAEGKVGCFLFLRGKEEAANKKAEAALDELAKSVKEGKFELYEAPVDPAISESGEAKKPPEAPKHELGIVKISRDDPKEEWLVRAIMSVDPDLLKEEQPMAFMAYGRGRLLPPYIGKGIEVDNLLVDVMFISGACSCTVKEQNPGIELLVRQDWEKAAANLARKFGGEEGAPYGMFFPELVIPSGRPDGATELASEKSAEDKTVVTEGRQESVSPASQSPAAKEPLAAEKPAVAEKPVEAEKPTAGTESAAKPAPATETVSSKNAPSPADPPNRDTGDAAIANGVAVAAADTHANRIAPDTTLAQTTSIYGSVFVVAAGLVVALLILAAVTFRVLRPR